jgi:hypothetical protein
MAEATDNKVTQGAKTLASKILAVKNEIGKVSKDGTGMVGNEHKGTQKEIKYATLSKVLECVMPVLSKHGIDYVVAPAWNDYSVQLISQGLRLFSIHFVDTDTLETSEPIVYPFRLAINPDPIKADGSTITYVTRYLLGLALGLQTEEDPDARTQSPQQCRQSAQNQQPPTQNQTPTQGQQQPETKQSPKQSTKTPERPVKYGDGYYGASNIKAGGEKLKKGEVNSSNFITPAHFVFSVAKGLYSCMSDMPGDVRASVENYLEHCVKFGVVDAPSKPDYEDKINAESRKKIEDIIDFYNNFSRK